MFIVIEGLDGAGKSTQVAELIKWFEVEQGKSVKFLHFPRFDAPIYGELIAKFLRGELGDNDSVNPYLVALLYAGDRAEAAEMIRGWLDAGEVVILDRYVLSNVAYQCAKLSDKESKATLKEWILDLEFVKNNIPKPDLNIFLSVPFDFTKSKLEEHREGSDRDYLQGKKDIHEASLSFQERVREVYMEHSDEKYFIVDCATQHEMLPIEEISKKIQKLVLQCQEL